MTERQIMNGVYAFFVGAVLVAVLTILFTVMSHAQSLAPTLSYKEGRLRPFVVTDIPSDATFVGIEFRSLQEADYAYSTGVNIEAGTGTSFAFDWKYVDCTLDSPEWPYCAKGDYEVHAWTEGPGLDAPKTVSNVLNWSK